MKAQTHSLEPHPSHPPHPAAGPCAGRSGATQDAIRLRAHQIYLVRRDSGAAGDDVSDWLAAEREVRGAVGHAPGACKGDCAKAGTAPRIRVRATADRTPQPAR